MSCIFQMFTSNSDDPAFPDDILENDFLENMFQENNFAFRFIITNFTTYF